MRKKFWKSAIFLYFKIKKIIVTVSIDRSIRSIDLFFYFTCTVLAQGCPWPVNIFSTELKFKRGGCQNLERWNVERPTFRNFKIANRKMKESYSIVLLSHLFFHFLEIISTIFSNFSNCKILIFHMVKFFLIF